MKKLETYFCGWGQHWHLGTLAHAGRSLLFEYSEEALSRKLELSPLKLALRKNAYQGFPATQAGLPGLIADALPDGWGQQLMDRCFTLNHRSLNTVSPLDRLAFIHDRAMGALVFTPADSLSANAQDTPLLALANDAQLVFAGTDTDALHQLAITGASPQGVRPKVLIQYDRSNGQVSTLSDAPGTPWMVKFQMQGEDKEACALEAAYASLARACGLDMPATHLFDLSKSLAGFGIERFDRQEKMRVPMLSLAALLDVDFRRPSLDYTSFLNATRALTKDEREVKKAFERCVFNVAFNNRDDHPKNFAYVMDKELQWKLAPCFDLTYNTGLNGEHHMPIHSESRRPDRNRLLNMASECGLPLTWSTATVDRIAAISGTFATAASAWPISAKTIQRISSVIEENRRRIS